jgi:hypothetical protein
MITFSKKREYTFEELQEEYQEHIEYDECITIPKKLINNISSDDDTNKNPKKQKQKHKFKKKSSKNEKPTEKSTDKSIIIEDDTTEETNLEYNSGSWRNKRSRFDVEFNENQQDALTMVCENPNCDHYLHPLTWYEDNKITISNVNTLDDLILLGSFYHCKMRLVYNEIDMKVLYSIKSPLTELKNMIGLNKIKEEIVNTIIYFLLTKNLSKDINSDMMHSVITGSPGSGKTTFIEILAKIYVGLGVLQQGHIVKTRRSELIGKFLGHTAVQTQKKIEEAYGGILLIDEAYALGNPEGRDSFSKECLDTLNQALTENKKDFICIIAGYKNALDESFFKYNEGLKRRFPFRYDIEKYTADELSLILYKKIEEYGHFGINKISIFTPEFTITQLQNLIKDNFNYFQNQGGDMESIFLGSKIAQNKRVFLLEKEEKKKLLLNDIKTAINKFIELHKLKDSYNDFAMRTMYI